jgi:hypothetical protein
MIKAMTYSVTRMKIYIVKKPFVKNHI